MTLQGVILDIDGTLVLSNDAHAEAWVEAFKKFGHQIEFEQVRPMIGMGGDKIIPKLVPGLSSEEGEGKKLADYRKELFLNKYASTITPANGARELLLKMQDEGLRLVVASSAKSEELSVLLKIAEIDDLLEETTTSSDADSSKPDPDIVKAALNKSQLQPDRVIMLGDTPYDIESANAVGVDVIAFRCGGFDDNQLAKAIAIYDDPAELLAQYDHSPIS
ncbi:HAD family hydrolase [Chlorogloeopsis fritschii PCC 9212]|uniref:Phosphoglycolate phosphatase n=1 Tax=Chlorogloeopsis fritschii PCC 6912 TaxID=211165 RepID=A0A433MW31_CHLFR|nr:HAD family hydrolase [Chlorogloeopsis fritschii]MBF2007260.1 HAD family hydrolase [Chlorogloeopsis fritschii C42_A2020_084]RUR72119.1 phosphoglycolate phosphatase [Chlorogloeopsis fritschii PCC 6912]